MINKGHHQVVDSGLTAKILYEPMALGNSVSVMDFSFREGEGLQKISHTDPLIQVDISHCCCKGGHVGVAVALAGPCDAAAGRVSPGLGLIFRRTASAGGAGDAVVLPSSPRTASGRIAVRFIRSRAASGGAALLLVRRGAAPSTITASGRVHVHVEVRPGVLDEHIWGYTLARASQTRAGDPKLLTPSTPRRLFTQAMQNSPLKPAWFKRPT